VAAAPLRLLQLEGAFQEPMTAWKEAAAAGLVECWKGDLPRISTIGLYLAGEPHLVRRRIWKGLTQLFGELDEARILVTEILDQRIDGWWDRIDWEASDPPARKPNHSVDVDVGKLRLQMMAEAGRLSCYQRLKPAVDWLWNTRNALAHLDLVNRESIRDGGTKLRQIEAEFVAARRLRRERDIAAALPDGAHDSAVQAVPASAQSATRAPAAR